METIPPGEITGSKEAELTTVPTTPGVAPLSASLTVKRAELGGVWSTVVRVTKAE